MLDILSAPLLEIATRTTSPDCIDMQIHASAKIRYSLMYLLGILGGAYLGPKVWAKPQRVVGAGGGVAGDHTERTSKIRRSADPTTGGWIERVLWRRG